MGFKKCTTVTGVSHINHRKPHGGKVPVYVFVLQYSVAISYTYNVRQLQ